MVGRAVDEDLRFVFQPAEAAAVKDAVAVALKTGPYRMVGFFVSAAETACAVRGVRGKVAGFKLFPFLSGVCHGGILTL